jgi:hypothetical protein
MSEIEAIISVKNDLEPGASCCSNLQEEDMDSRYQIIQRRHVFNVRYTAYRKQEMSNKRTHIWE